MGSNDAENHRASSPVPKGNKNDPIYLVIARGGWSQLHRSPDGTFQSRERTLVNPPQISQYGVCCTWLPSYPHPSPGRLAFCSPTVTDLVWGWSWGWSCTRGCRDLSAVIWNLILLKSTHRCSSKDPGSSQNFLEIAMGSFWAQTIPELSDSCQHLGLVLRVTLCKSNYYMWALLGHLTSPSYFPLSWEAVQLWLVDVVSLHLTRIRKCEHWNGSGPQMAGRLTHLLLFHILGFHTHQCICKERSDT